ncbi:MAG TPA: alkaline phosphatase family protein [Aggregatilineales bacterium]|nr:alkaline phosphatase family protein [Aggregatilineales bacterium]
MTLAQELLTRYRANRPLSLDVSWEDEIIYPAYDGFSIANLAQTIGHILGADYPTPLHPMLGIPTDVDRVVLFISDGVGYLRLQDLIQTDPEVAELVTSLTNGRGATPITSIAPSTTVAALNTFWTGVAPATHGIMGTVLFLRELAMMSDMLYFKPYMGNMPLGTLEAWGLDPTTLTRTPTLGQKLAERGVPTHLLSDKGLLGSGLSKMLHVGIEYKHKHVGFQDMWGELRKILHDTRGQKTYVSMYLHNMDILSHYYHAVSSQTGAEIKNQLRELHRIVTDPEIADGRTLFMFVADHGHEDAPNFIHLDSPENMPFYETLRMFYGGDARLGHLYLRDGYRERALELGKQLFADKMALIPSETALEAGLFGIGDVHPEAIYRLGDLITILRPTYRHVEKMRPSDKTISLHAGLSAWEMLVPLLWKVI